MTPISAGELAAWLSEPAPTGRPTPQLLDVREPWEFRTCHLEGAQLVPIGEVAQRVSELDESRPIICICHHGARSAQVAHYLESRGLSQVYNLSGGLDGWSREVDPSFPRY